MKYCSGEGFFVIRIESGVRYVFHETSSSEISRVISNLFYHLCCNSFVTLIMALFSPYVNALIVVEIVHYQLSVDSRCC